MSDSGIWVLCRCVVKNSPTERTNTRWSTSDFVASAPACVRSFADSRISRMVSCVPNGIEATAAMALASSGEGSEMGLPGVSRFSIMMTFSGLGQVLISLARYARQGDHSNRRTIHPIVTKEAVHIAVKETFHQYWSPIGSGDKTRPHQRARDQTRACHH